MSVTRESHWSSEIPQSAAIVVAAANVYGWCFFVLLYVFGESPAVLRQDPEFEPMGLMADSLTRLAPMVMIAGLVATIWNPRWLGLSVASLGLIGTMILVLAR